MPKTTIKFHRPYSPYISGDVATFPAEQAERFIRSGYANRQMTADGPVGQRPTTESLPATLPAGARSPEPPATPAKQEPVSEAAKPATRRRIKQPQ